MISVGFSTNTPVDIVVLGWVVSRFITFVPVAETTSTATFAATIVIGNDVTLSICGVLAGTHPGYRRRFRTWRAG